MEESSEKRWKVGKLVRINGGIKRNEIRNHNSGNLFFLRLIYITYLRFYQWPSLLAKYPKMKIYRVLKEHIIFWITVSMELLNVKSSGLKLKLIEWNKKYFVLMIFVERAVSFIPKALSGEKFHFNFLNRLFLLTLRIFLHLYQLNLIII